MEFKTEAPKFVSLRDIWQNEEHNFTPWLKKEISHLNKHLPFEVIDLNEQVRIGTKRADIVGIEEQTGEKVVIEIQYGCTDHNHLGKLMVYMGNIGATKGVWLVETCEDVYKNAIEWLNSIQQEIEFYLFQIKILKKDDKTILPIYESIVFPRKKPKPPSSRAKTRKIFWDKLISKFPSNHAESISFLKDLNPNRDHHNFAYSHGKFVRFGFSIYLNDWTFLWVEFVPQKDDKIVEKYIQLRKISKRESEEKFPDIVWDEEKLNVLWGISENNLRDTKEWNILQEEMWHKMEYFASFFMPFLDEIFMRNILKTYKSEIKK
jgi:hypothetical protein